MLVISMPFLRLRLGTPDYTLPPLRTAVLAQILGGLIAIGLLALLSPRTLSQPLLVAIAQGVAAAFTSYKLESPPWWHGIHLGFMPLVVLASRADIHPLWYLAAFVALLLIFWRITKNRVPLFLSSQETIESLASLLPPQACRIIDLGCGNARLLRRLADLRPDCSFVGVEHAPLPWLWARIRCVKSTNCMILRKDFWGHSLAEFDVVFAFLSPVPMKDVWQKAVSEMPHGALFISNTFEIPGQSAERVEEVPDHGGSCLFCYRLPGPPPGGAQLGP